MARCTTAHGPYRCDLPAGHPGECETEAGPRSRVRVAPAGFDTQRELVRAAARIEILAKALREIQTAPCDSASGASCLCCLHDRTIAVAALRVLE